MILILFKKDNDLGMVNFLIKNGSQIDEVDADGRTPLWYAVYSIDDNDEILKTLVLNGADFNVLDNEGHSPVMVANTHKREVMFAGGKERKQKKK